MERCDCQATKDLISQMRCSGATMREIGEKVGLSRERVRQILTQISGSTRYQWLSTAQVCKALKMPRNRMGSLQETGIIRPVFNWEFEGRRYALWEPSVTSEILEYYEGHRLCQVCHQPLPKNRIRFCSDNCRFERHKYKNRTPDEKRRMLLHIKQYRERKKLSAISISPRFARKAVIPLTPVIRRKSEVAAAVALGR